jgi:putative flippase GtrA
LTLLCIYVNIYELKFFKKAVKVMAKNLKDIDKAAESKGSFLVTVWQFVKFIVVSLLAMIVQFVLLNTLQLIPAIQELYKEPFSWWVFIYPVAVGGLGYFIVSNVANIIAQIVAFFVNKEKTFNSGANVAVALPIYIVFTIALILFSAWLNPTLKEVFIGFDWCNETMAKNIATMICSALQFFLYFPVDKILFHKKKEEK